MSGKTFKPEQQRRKAIAYTIPNHLIDRLVTYAKYNNTSRSKVVSEALEVYLSVVEEDMYKKMFAVESFDEMMGNLNTEDSNTFNCIIEAIQQKTNMKRDDILLKMLQSGINEVLSGNADIPKDKIMFSERLQNIKSIICKDAIQ